MTYRSEKAIFDLEIGLEAKFTNREVFVFRDSKFCVLGKGAAAPFS